jgi:transmembrane sensor
MASGDDLLVGTESVPQAEQSLSWRSGYLVFRESTLAEAAAEFNRYNSLRITIADPSVASIRLSGKFRTTDAEAFIRLLEGGFRIQARRSANRIDLVSASAHVGDSRQSLV